MLVAYQTDDRYEVYQHREPHKHRRNTIAASRPPPIRSTMDLEKILVRSIGERTGGRVRSLKVHILGERVILRGWASSYHVVQLAIAGLFETFHAMNLDRPDEVGLDIDVQPNGPVCSFGDTPVPVRCENAP
jgi:hypothetical protein